MDASAFFSADYATARQRFCDAAADAEYRLSSYPLQARGPDGDALTIDVAANTDETGARDALVVSSGLHGVEGFFGSAVQLAFLNQWKQRRKQASRPRCVLIHALNPYGFAWLRRANEENIDLNRNLLLPDERYEGSPPDYGSLDLLLNPKTAPSRIEPLLLKLLLALARHGMPALKRAITAGQYEFPQGLFYGGPGPAQSHRILSGHFDEWLDGCQRVIHLDLHSGLGRNATYKLLVDYPVDADKRERLAGWFGRDIVEVSDIGGVAYTATGNFGRWCWSRAAGRDYTYAAAEFGTYSALQVLAGLRAENQAHHWGEPQFPSTKRAKARLREALLPP